MREIFGMEISFCVFLSHLVLIQIKSCIFVLSTVEIIIQR